jgi:signal transduction histidine kinase
MIRRRWWPISLARKLSLLFGTAVLLTIAVTLLFPWLQMSALSEQAVLLQAKRIAFTAYQAVDLRQSDWAAAQRQLENVWSDLFGDADLSDHPPKFVPVSIVMSGGFRREACDVLQRHPERLYYWRTQDDGNLFRFAMAVRGGNADPYPHVLRGIIDVQLEGPQTGGLWNTFVTVLAGASGCVLAILVFYMVTQRIVLSPVHALRRVAERVTGGDLNVRAAIDTGDEFEELSRTLNEMLAHLEAAQKEQERINRSLDIRLGELAETNVALYEANRLKSQFLTNVTHELRTPLVSIIGFAELVRDAQDSAEVDRNRLKRFSEHILTSARSLLEIINDLLDLAKIEAGRMERHLSEFALEELCRDLMDFVRPLADKRNQRLDLSTPDHAPRCYSDSGKIKQVLYNLLSNAIKFTPTGGAIGLSMDHNGEHVTLRVRDSGPGIPEAMRETIFEQFRQLDASASREHEGTGLGLAITRELVTVLGGMIRVESIEGAGSTFIVELPLRVTEAVERPRMPLV